MGQRILLNAVEINIILHRLACQLVENHTDFKNTVIIGIQPRGVFLAERIIKILQEKFLNYNFLNIIPENEMKFCILTSNLQNLHYIINF